MSFLFFLAPSFLATLKGACSFFFGWRRGFFVTEGLCCRLLWWCPCLHPCVCASVRAPTLKHHKSSNRQHSSLTPSTDPAQPNPFRPSASQRTRDTTAKFASCMTIQGFLVLAVSMSMLITVEPRSHSHSTPPFSFYNKTAFFDGSKNWWGQHERRASLCFG